VNTRVDPVRAITVWLLAATLVLTACGCSSERAVYRAARRALEADPAIPENAEPMSRQHARLYVAKNAAYAEIPYTYVDDSGREYTATYGAWIKRVARTWVFDRKGP